MIIPRAMTFPFVVQVDHRDHFCLFITLAEDDPHMLGIGGSSFQCVPGAALVLQITFLIIYIAVFHYILYLSFGNMTAGHPACSMVTVFQVRNAPVKSPVAVDGAAFFLSGSILLR